MTLHARCIMLAMRYRTAIFGPKWYNEVEILIKAFNRHCVWSVTFNFGIYLFYLNFEIW